jgi:hypothetical protein
MHSDVERADATLVQLADVLRATLDVSGQQQAPLSTELRLLRGYARLMEERFIDRVRIEWDVDASCGACLVPVMSMQPLLENVFKHTVERRRGVTARSPTTPAACPMQVGVSSGNRTRPHPALALACAICANACRRCTASAPAWP